ncbi:MAG: S-adenosylmethionine:tRNA ribosyltransferase-isomerase, partial [Collinsella sp.]|nr:S-adenosylmethionine:tRNA ribosyltransferase-isomerase [Collinsella sp.]
QAHLVSFISEGQQEQHIVLTALASRDQVMDAYAAAIEQRYRFFSFGDAMLIC